MSQQGHDPRSVANYLVKKAASDVNGQPLTIVHLLKLVYFAHGWHLGRTGQPLINRPVEAWKYGPVIPEVYDAFRPEATRGLTVEKLATNRRGDVFEAELNEEEKKDLDRSLRSLRAVVRPRPIGPDSSAGVALESSQEPRPLRPHPEQRHSGLLCGPD